MKLWFVVPAAGLGLRLGGGVPKQYLAIAGRTVIEHTLTRLLSLRSTAAAEPAAIVVAIGAGDDRWPQLPVAANPLIHTAAGGDERADSVRAGLRLLADKAADDDWVLVHDVARPCITAGDIASLVETLGDDPVGGILAAPVSDTLKRVDDHDRIQGTQERCHLWSAMTPQMFRYGLLCRALDAATAAGLAVTDEASAVEALGLAPKVVPGRRDNIKITHREDLAVAEAILAHQQRQAQQRQSRSETA